MPKKWCLSSNQTDNRRASGFIKHRATRGVRHRLYPTVMSVHQSRILMDAIRPVRCQPCATSPWGRDSRASTISCDGAVLPQRQFSKQRLRRHQACIAIDILKCQGYPKNLFTHALPRVSLALVCTAIWRAEFLSFNDSTEPDGRCFFLRLIPRYRLPWQDNRPPGFFLTGDSVSIEADERQ
ncbi:hypothetical protein SOD10_05570 [Serratia plymuthica]|nr:hypothetical protein SOD10_05570 [Serratia plymuthica]